jgi:hypothetical protein
MYSFFAGFLLVFLISYNINSEERPLIASISMNCQTLPRNLPTTFPVFNKIINRYYLNTSENLEKEAFKWYKIGNRSEVMAQILGGTTPIFVSCSAWLSNPRLKFFFTIAAGISSTLAISSGNFSRFSHNESRQRFTDLNTILKAKGYNPLPLMGATLSPDSHVVASGENSSYLSEAK